MTVQSWVAMVIMIGHVSELSTGILFVIGSWDKIPIHWENESGHSDFPPKS